LGARLAALSPLAVLARGYAIATLPGGRAIRAAAEVNPGDAISIRVSAGRIGARVTDTESGEDKP
jgi:exodeoxyribonuclease VII large subunit